MNKRSLVSLHQPLFCFLFVFFLSYYFPAESFASIRSLVGYKHISLNEHFNHNTHPNDSFLPNANQSGSAGTTRIQGTSWLFLGARYLREDENTALNIDLGGLLGRNKNKTKNANDSRPDSTASFIYSKAEMGISGAVGYSWKKGRFKWGAEAQLSAIYIESGWDRFDNQEKEKSKIKLVPTIGPKVGITLWDDNLWEFTVQGGEAFSAGTNVQFRFW